MASVLLLSTGEQPYLSFTDPYPLGHEVVEAETGTDAIMQAQNLRKAVGALCASELPSDSALVRGIDLKFSAQVPIEALDVDLDHDHVMDWIERTSDEELVNFCTWSVDRYTSHQAALNVVAEELQEDAINRARRLVDVSLFPSYAPRLFAATFQKIGSLRPLDAFQAAALGADQCYFGGDQRRIGIANNFDDRVNFNGINRDMRQGVFHEDVHAMADTSDRGFRTPLTTRFRSISNLGIVAEEVYVTHSTSVSQCSGDPHPDIIFPSARPEDITQAAYTTLVATIGLLMVHGSERIPVNSMTEAYFESTYGRNTSRRSLRHALNLNLASLLPSREKGPSMPLPMHMP